jgi:hypothetical protein
MSPPCGYVRRRQRRASGRALGPPLIGVVVVVAQEPPYGLPPLVSAFPLRDPPKDVAVSDPPHLSSGSRKKPLFAAAFRRSPPTVSPGDA